MRNVVISLLLCIYFFPVCAQDSINVLNLFEKSFEVANGRCMGGKFKGQIVKGRRNGMGFILNKGSFLYAGDFYRGDVTGMGIMISPNGVEGCPEGMVYVGNWEKGKKNGFGRCYNDAGDIVYQGMFSEDVPQGMPANAKIDKTRRFSFCKLGDNMYYVGEFCNGIANGMGVVIFSDGGLWQSHLKDGSLSGVGLYCAYDGSWQTRNVTGEEYSVVTSSDDYKMNDAIRKQNAVLSWSDVSNALGALSQSLSNASSTSLGENPVGLVRNEGVSLTTADQGNAVSSTKTKRSQSLSSNERMSISELNNYNTDKRTWANYDTYLAAHFFGGREATLSDVRKWQQAMAGLRAKWKAKGKSFPVSSNENRSTAHCISKSHGH